MRLLVCLLLFTCSPGNVISKLPTANAGEVDPICHTPVKIKKEATRIVFIDCAGSETEMKFSEVTGPAGKDGAKGDAGANGGPGRQGDPGQPGPDSDKTMKWCHHDETTHRNQTMTLKISEIIAKFGGYKGAQDLPGDCGETENVCVCDATICQNARPQVTHYFADPSYD